MRVAILSDIHGNLPALEAVVADVKHQSPDQIWCGGDLAWGGPWPSECIARVRDSGWTTVRGNTDVWITGDPQTIQDNKKRKEVADLAAAHEISDLDAQWLLNLPIGHNGPGSVLLVHGTPHSPFEAPEPDAPVGEFGIYEGKASLVVYGHVHIAFSRRLSEGTLVSNPGAVGLPKDGPTASYLLVDQKGPDLLLSHRRVGFDIDAAISEAKNKGGLVAESFIEGMRDL
ncbi:MAG: metallophosphatase family protein [Actinomycetota bacterium]|nr:metallophosphatase family protein [Actinomycetota bacterium]